MSYGAYHPAVINKEDHDYLNAHALKINEKGKWHHKDYEPHHKWTQVVSGTNYLYNVLADGKDKVTVQLYRSLQGGVDSEVTLTR
jgi:hypothetical protein